ncbi:Leucine-rich repeat-containing protein 58 [Eumeta japonica]|uniref:Leucine-rich repeat-containing protein 58 n=1 Tax=Eumeta variegata TaxID=151549 RepID=A0A4C1UC28_EUMVA|nr:Leucine-rich repeat-containing protein 58 [Eumeta japonica]
MECYTSDSCDSDSREQKTLDLSSKLFDTVELAIEVDSIIDEKNCADRYETALLYNNRIKELPEALNRFANLKILDVSNNRLTSLSNILEHCPLTSLIAKHNQLTNESLPKCFNAGKNTLRELNLSGNRLNFFPEQLLELTSLKYLYLGGNRIINIPKEIWKLSRRPGRTHYRAASCRVLLKDYDPACLEPLTGREGFQEI